MKFLPQQYGRYQLVEEIGRGGMGIVYKAFDPEMKRFVALKVLIGFAHGDEVQRFQREINATAQLAHPSIVTIHNSGISKSGRPYQVLEYLAGQSLKDWALKEQAPISQVVAIMTQVAQAVDFAHSKGFIHRDIKAANVFLCDSGEAKLLDFGIAKCLFELKGESLTQSGVVLGSLPYMAPEQLRNEPITPSLDVYALGATLYFLLTRQTPFDASQSPIRLALDIEEKTPENPQVLNPELSKELADICLKAMEKRPENRFPGASDFAQALEDLGKENRNETAKPSRTIRRLAVAVVLLAILSTGWIYIKEAPQSSLRPESKAPAIIKNGRVKKTNSKLDQSGFTNLPILKVSQAPLFVHLNDDRFLDIILVGQARTVPKNLPGGEQMIAVSGKTGALLWRCNEALTLNARPRWQSYSKKSQAIVVGVFDRRKGVPALAWIDKSTGKVMKKVQLPGIESSLTEASIRIAARDRKGTGQWGWTATITANKIGQSKKDTFIFHLSKRGNIEEQTSLMEIGLNGNSMSYGVYPVPRRNKAPIQYFFQLNNSIVSYTLDPSRKEPQRWLRGLRDGLPRSIQFRNSPSNPLEVLELIQFKVKSGAEPISHLRIRNIETGLERWPSGSRYKQSVDIVWAEFFQSSNNREAAPFLTLTKDGKGGSVIQTYNHRGKKLERRRLEGSQTQPCLLRRNQKQFLFLYQDNSKSMRIYSLPGLKLSWERKQNSSSPLFYPVDIDKDGSDELLRISDQNVLSIVKLTPN